MENYPATIDLKKKAKKKMPLVAWEYLDSGTGDENLLKRNTEDFKKIVPYAKKIKLYSKRGTLFEKLYRVIEFEKKKNECLKELYEDKTSGDL